MTGPSKRDVIIVGAGLAGLACGLRLAQRGIDFEILEAGERVGGRVGTDVVDGFRLDHGFQVLLTAYPAAQELLDYPSLELRPFDAGAHVRLKDSFTTLDDPWQRPMSALATVFSPVGSITDKLRLERLRRDLTRGSLEELYERVQQPTKYRVLGLGFHSNFIERFLRPWLGGIFLDTELETSSRVLDFVLRMLTLGEAAVPANGMQAIPQQLANRLPAGSIRLQSTVQELTRTTIETTDGSQQTAKEVVIAVEEPAAAKLLGWTNPMPWRSVACLYFAADHPPMNTSKLVLSARGNGPINNFCEISSVAPEYAPDEQTLLSVSVLNPPSDPWTMESAVRDQLIDWFGLQVDGWRLLRTYHIPYALPNQNVHRMQSVIRPVDVAEQPVICGDYCETSSIQGALNSGMRAADAVIGRLASS